MQDQLTLGAPDDVVLKVSHFNAALCCRIVREAKPDSTAYGGLTCVTKYELIEKPEQVVDSTCMPDRLAHNTRGRDDAMVIITEHKLYSNGNDD